MGTKDRIENILKGTTTIGIVCSDGVVMGADTRVTMDTYIASAEGVKVFKIDEALGITIAGGVGDANYLVKVLKVQNELYKMDEGKQLSPSAASSLLSIILQENRFSPYYAAFIVGGLQRNGTPELYTLDPYGAALKESRFISVGSGQFSALGYLDSVYVPTLTVQEAVKHAIKALQMAMKRDAASGDSIKIVAITKKGFKEYTKEEIEKLLK